MAPATLKLINTNPNVTSSTGRPDKVNIWYSNMPLIIDSAMQIVKDIRPYNACRLSLAAYKIC